MEIEPISAFVFSLLSTFSMTPIIPTISVAILADTNPELPILLDSAVSRENKRAIPMALKNEAVFGDIRIFIVILLISTSVSFYLTTVYKHHYYNSPTY